MNTTEIRRLASRARRGDYKALKIMQDENIKLSRKLNDRLRNLEKSSAEVSPAYKRAKYVTKSDKPRFKGNVDDISTLERQLLDINKILDMKTSTIRGYNQMKRNTINTFKEKGLNISDSDLFNNFLNSSEFSEFVKFDSERALLEGSQALNEGKTLKDLEYEWERYKSGEIDMMDAWQNWTKVEEDDL